MIGILNRWRQFGRYYFWPHLLLGMVAASLGLPHASAHDRTILPETSSRSLNIGSAVRFDGIVLLQDSARRPAFSVDYWHQHAIRTVIRHLSFTLTPSKAQAAEAIRPLEAHKLALLDTLNALLTHETRSPTATTCIEWRGTVAFPVYQTGLWRVTTGGIRAGPASLS